MTANHILQLAEALQRGNLALFIGADLPQAVTGRPSRADLTAGLAQRLGLSGPPRPWPEVAARYESERGRKALIAWLRDQLESAENQPGPIYRLLAQLPVTTYITTAYDTWLHGTLREAGRKPNTLVASAGEVGFAEANQPSVVHIFGVYDRPESLVLTAAQMQQLPHAKAPIMASLVHPALSNKQVLILGQDLHDAYFQQIYQAALFQAGTIRSRVFAAWLGLDKWEQRAWLEQNVEIVGMPAMNLLAQLLEALQAEASTPSPVADSDAAAPPRPTVIAAERFPALIEPAPPAPSLPVQPADSYLAAARDLLLAAFTAEDLRRLVLYTPNSALRPLVNEFSVIDGLATMVDKTITFCHKRGLLPALLDEVRVARPNQYDGFEPKLRM